MKWLDVLKVERKLFHSFGLVAHSFFVKSSYMKNEYYRNIFEKILLIFAKFGCGVGEGNWDVLVSKAVHIQKSNEKPE